jgi:LDH2 family malate/lactate/ureidoglycolate dehydrogenase
MNNYIGRVSANALFSFCVTVFSKVGVPRKEAELVSEHLVLADLRGVDSHGALIRIPHYLRGIKEGLINPRPNVRLVKETTSTALVDGDNCLGQVAAMRATELAAEKAKVTGVGVVGARNINHVGMLSHYALRAIGQGLFAMVYATSPPIVAPVGSKKPLLGSNPLCIGFPIDEKTSIILDMATSTVAAGKIAMATGRGERIPEGWALDKQGRPTTDPKAYLEGGMLLPFGGYKGYGLSLAIEALAGILIGAPYSIYIKRGWATQGGFVIEALDIDAFRPYEAYKRDMLDLLKLVKSCPLAEGFDEILLPGELESREHERRSRDGVPVYKEPWEDLRKVSEDLGVELPILA